MFHLGRQDMTPLSLESLALNKLIRNKKIRKKKPSLVAPLMKQYLRLMNIAAEYLVIFTTIQIMDDTGRPTTRCELLEMVQEEAEKEAFPCCFDKIELTGMGMGPTPPKSLSGGIEVTCLRDHPTLFAWGVEYNYDVAGCSFTRVYYKDGGVIKENWFLEDDNDVNYDRPESLTRPVKWLLMSTESLTLGEDIALIWRNSKWINGVLDQEDLTMHWTAKAVRITY
jgi:hypothetical protein